MESIDLETCSVSKHELRIEEIRTTDSVICLGKHKLLISLLATMLRTNFSKKSAWRKGGVRWLVLKARQPVNLTPSGS